MRVEVSHRPMSSLRLDEMIVVRRVRSTRVWSRFVWLMRGVLPGAVLGLFTLLIAWPSLMVPDTRTPLGDAPRTKDLASADANMLNPRYYGVDIDSRPYSVSADKAKNGDGTSGTVTLDKPRADTVLQDGAGVLLDADLGVYYHADQKIDLFGNVNVYHDRGYEIHTEEAHMDLAAGIAQGSTPVKGHGPAMQLEGEGFRITDRGRTIVITGSSRVILYPAKRDAEP